MKSPLEVSCWRKGPWTGRGADVSVVLDLMIHDLDLVHQLDSRQGPQRAGARGALEKAVHRRRSLRRRHCSPTAPWRGSKPAASPKTAAAACARSMRDGVVEIDFLTRKVTQHHAAAAQARWKWAIRWPSRWRPSCAAVRHGRPPLVRPQQARRALETALLIDEPSDTCRRPCAGRIRERSPTRQPTDARLFYPPRGAAKQRHDRPFSHRSGPAQSL